MSEQEQTLVFVHIPKTAGSTLHAILDKKYKRVFHIDGLKPQESLDTFEALSKEEQNKFEVLKGHYTFKLLKYIEAPLTLTYLRNPVDQFLSTYYYVKRATWNRDHEVVKNMQSIDDFIDFAIENGIDNLQTRHLSDTIQVDKTIQLPDMRKEGATLLEIAKRNLQNIDFVFHTQQFDESLLVLRKHLGWKAMPVYVTKNKTAGRKKTSELDAGVRSRIEEMNKFDIELFDYSKQMNAELLAKYDLESDLKKFHSKNERYQKLNNNKLVSYSGRILHKAQMLTKGKGR